jgi:pseudouridine-5'-phosphate glycosidase
VALESTLISHGLPYPQNLEVACAAEAAVSEAGAVPATIAICDGRIRVGLDRSELEGLASAPPGSVVKAARPNLAAALSVAGWAATTVSATMLAADAAGIRVFATGGIGGVHHGANDTFDVSSDLDELARTPVAVVCAGPKSILDVPATLEYLETRGVPVVTLGQDEVPGFYARSSGVRSPWRVEDVDAAAGLIRAHLGLGLGSGMLVCVAVPADDAMGEEEARVAIERAIADAGAAGVTGPELTPWLLARIAEVSDGTAVRANTALIVNNARVAAEIAGQLGR